MKPLVYKDGYKEKVGLTVAELRAALSQMPNEAVVVGAWEGILVPVHSATLVQDHEHVADAFVELDVDDV